MEERDVFRTDSTGMPGGDPKTRLFEKYNRCLNAFGFCGETKMLVVTMG